MDRVGLTQFERLIAATHHYMKRGYEELAVPWAVSERAMAYTSPPWWKKEPSYTVNTGLEKEQRLHIVASAEQSFLEEAHPGLIGKYVALTPCFRNERNITSLHQPYFAKVELIRWYLLEGVPQEFNFLHNMIEDAHDFFSQYLNVDVIENREDAKVHNTMLAYDIVSRKNRIELGSYGVRHYPDVGCWIYGTGCAEPRLTNAVHLEQS